MIYCKKDTLSKSAKIQKGVSMEERNEISHEAGASDAVETPAPELTRSQRWEAQKQKEREEQEARYKDAPFLTKIFELYFGKPLVILSVLKKLRTWNRSF